MSDFQDLALVAVGLLVAVGFRPTIRMSHSDRTSDVKWDSSVLVEACNITNSSIVHPACHVDAPGNINICLQEISEPPRNGNNVCIV